MVEVFVTAEFERQFGELPVPIKKKAQKQEKLFRQNPLHPSLHVEKLEPRHKQLWSFRVDRKYRILFRFINKDKVIFLTVGHHDWIYKI